MNSDSKTADQPKNAPTPQKQAMTAQQVAVQALEKIEKLGLNPVPQLYELWFRYYQGDPEQDIQALLERNSAR
jgi:hypothetical protein